MSDVKLHRVLLRCFNTNLSLAALLLWWWYFCIYNHHQSFKAVSGMLYKSRFCTTTTIENTTYLGNAGLGDYHANKQNKHKFHHFDVCVGCSQVTRTEEMVCRWSITQPVMIWQKSTLYISSKVIFRNPYLIYLTLMCNCVALAFSSFEFETLIQLNLKGSWPNFAKHFFF